MKSPRAPFFLTACMLLATLAGCISEFDTRSSEPEAGGPAAYAPSDTPDFQYASPDGALAIQQDGTHLTGSYTSGGRTVYIETLRGEATPAEMQAADADAPPFAIDLRLMDSDHATFILVVGGHELVDPTWQYPEDVEVESTDPEYRLSHFLLAREAATAIAEVEFPMDLAWEWGLMVDAGSFVSDEFLRYDTIPVELDAESAEGALPLDENPFGIEMGVVDGSVERSGSWTHYAQIRRKPAFGTVNVNGTNVNFTEHSALALYSYDNLSCSAVLVSCNHGACALDSTMSTKCGRGWSGRSSQYPPFRDLACSTPYGIHVCNNDTMVQYAMARNQSNLSGWNVLCYGLQVTAPYCY